MKAYLLFIFFSFLLTRDNGREEDEERKMKLKVIVVKFLFLNGENGWMEGERILI